MSSVEPSSDDYEWICPPQQHALRYADVWELPVIVYALSSALVRVYLMWMLRRAGRTVFGMGARLQRHADVWGVPPDLQPYLHSNQVKVALSQMVSGDNMHVHVSVVEADAHADTHAARGDPRSVRLASAAAHLPQASAADKAAHTAPSPAAADGGGAEAAPSNGSCSGEGATRSKGGERALLAHVCHQLVLFFEGCFACAMKTFKRRNRQLKAQRAVSGNRYVPLSMEPRRTACS